MCKPGKTRNSRTPPCRDSVTKLCESLRPMYNRRPWLLVGMTSKSMHERCCCSPSAWIATYERIPLNRTSDSSSSNDGKNNWLFLILQIVYPGRRSFRFCLMDNRKCSRHGGERKSRRCCSYVSQSRMDCISIRKTARTTHQHIGTWFSFFRKFSNLLDIGSYVNVAPWWMHPPPFWQACSWQRLVPHWPTLRPIVVLVCWTIIIIWPVCKRTSNKQPEKPVWRGRSWGNMEKLPDSCPPRYSRGLVFNCVKLPGDWPAKWLWIFSDRFT